MSQQSSGSSPNQQLSKSRRSRIWGPKNIASLIYRYILRNILSIDPFEPDESSDLIKEDFRVVERLIHSNRWFIRMRWLACLVAAVLIIFTVEVLKYLDRDALWWLIAWTICLALSNVLYTLFLRRRWFTGALIEIQMFTDLIILTLMLHCSGGIENPLFFTYLFHIIIAGILLDRRKCYTVVVVAFMLFSILTFSEMTGVIGHRTLHIFPHIEEAEELSHAAHKPVYAVSLVLLQTIIMSLTAYFTTTIMEQLRSEEKRALMERQRLERVVEATEIGLTILDENLHPVWYNDTIREWLNLAKDATGELNDRLQEWSGGAGGPVSETFKDGKVRVVERELLDAHGNRYFFQVTVAPLMDEMKRVYQVAELTQDITQRKIVEAEMMHSAKMAVLGSMSAGIAHEVGNPLASISARLRRLYGNHDETFLKESIRLLESQIARIGRIVNGISQFARHTKESWEICEINQIITEVFNILLLHPKAKNCQINTELAAALPNTMGVKDQLIQVFINLGINALEAMPDGGTLTVKTHTVAGEIWIEFADTGVGITSHSNSKIFAPFFTTKDNGLGLGLYIVHNIVDAHDGRIEARSNDGGGSQFTVILPIRTPGKGSPGEIIRTLGQ